MIKNFFPEYLETIIEYMMFGLYILFATTIVSLIIQFNVFLQNLINTQESILNELHLHKRELYYCLIDDES